MEPEAEDVTQAEGKENVTKRLEVGLEDGTQTLSQFVGEKFSGWFSPFGILEAETH